MARSGQSQSPGTGQNSVSAFQRIPIEAEYERIKMALEAVQTEKGT
jgi:hypothetical protein